MKTAKMKEFLGKTTLVITLIFMLSCSEEEINPECKAIEQQAKSLLRKMNSTSDEKEKEHYHQKYLAEKHLLDECRK